MRRSQLIDTLHAMASEMDVPGYDWDMLLAEKTSHLSDLHAWLSEFYAHWLVERDDNVRQAAQYPATRWQRLKASARRHNLGARFLAGVWVGILLTLVPLFASDLGSSQYAPPTATEASVSDDRDAVLDFKGGRWYVDGHDTGVAFCPSEDSCATQWTGRNWWIFATPN